MPRRHTRGARDRGGGRRRASGQALVETIIALTIVMLIVMALINLAMLASTRHVLNFAAFSGARAAVYGGAGNPLDPRSLVRTVTDELPRGTVLIEATPGRDDFVVRVIAPFGYPLSGTGSRTPVVSRAPMYAQPDIKEAGDNAR